MTRVVSRVGLRAAGLPGGGVRLEMTTGRGSVALDLAARPDVTRAVAAVLLAAGIRRAVFEDGVLTVLDEPPAWAARGRT